jgi:hypothetical protein
MGETGGSFGHLGPSHAALEIVGGPTLLVTFETIKGIRSSQIGQLPLGLTVARARGWSSLTILADGPTWYRDADVYRFFDTLVDEAWFENFDRVVFYGAGMAGYAAAAFSVTAPGATVVALQPQATLDPAVAGWDPRFVEARRLSFADRYGFAPDMTEGAGNVFVIYDPDQALDAMHAALFRRPWTTLLPCPYLGHDIGKSLAEMSILPAVLAAAGTGDLDAQLFRAFYRGRRNHEPYLRNLLGKLDSDGRTLLAAILCRNVVNRLRLPGFEARLRELLEELASDGVAIPEVHLPA